MPAGSETERAPVRERGDAQRLLVRLESAMAGLVLALEGQTALIGAGRIREGLADEAGKAELSAAYLLNLQHAKANVVALARFAPEELRAFRARQAEFERIVDRNQTVLATARTVSESLIRGLAEEVERAARPHGYGTMRPHPHAVGSASPLVFSGRF